MLVICYFIVFHLPMGKFLIRKKATIDEESLNNVFVSLLNMKKKYVLNVSFGKNPIVPWVISERTVAQIYQIQPTYMFYLSL